ncbi:MAG: ankyrin repeat domain-containing protein [Lentisphaeraceae bacterium]|nr:ankyrin repeat domain-containing protein [Lentisphaeraceae bacterium]
MATKNEVKIMKMLLKAGADPNLLDQNNTSPLSRSIERSEVVMVKSLLSHGAMVGLKQVYKDHDSFLAARSGNLVRIKYLFKKGNVGLLNIRDKNGNTLMHMAAECGHQNVVEFLLKKGALINRKNSEGNTPLHLSVSNRKSNALAFMVKKGANVNARNNSGESPLHLAVWSTVYVEKLLDAGADINARDNFSDTPLNHAVENDNIKSVDKLLKCGADVNYRGFYGQTALHKASHNEEMVALLLHHHADFNIIDDFGNTSLQACTEHGNAASLKLLIEAGAEVNTANDLGETPLHRSVERNSSELVHVLVSNGARVDIQNNIGVTPLHLAADCFQDADFTVAS